jgi:hypothetical protein
MPRKKIGDVIEIGTNLGLAYALYTHEHRMMGSLLRVFERKFPSRPTDFIDLVGSPLQFETFFPLGAALHRNLVAIAGHVAIPRRLRDFPIFRNGVADLETRRVANWWLWDGKREWMIGSLGEEQKRYPIQEVINDTLLRERIESGWRSTNEI